MPAAAYRLGSHIILERIVEKATEDIILRAHGVGQGGDINQVTKDVIDGVIALRDNRFVQAAQNIPGLDHLANLGPSILAELAEKKADGLWPSRTGPEWQLARAVLKNLAPFLRGIGEGTADATQRLQEIHNNVDRTVSSTAVPPASRKASLDAVVVITLPGFGVAQPFYPVSLDASGAPEIDATGNVVVHDPVYNAFVRDYVARNTTTVPGRQQRGGPRTPPTTRYPAPITRVYTLQDWATEASRASVDPQVAQRLLTAFKPKPSVHWWDRQTDETRQKIVAIQLTRTRFPDRLPEGMGQRMDEEDLATSLQKSGSPPSMVHDFLAPVNIDGDNCVSAQDLEHFWHAADTWLGANQSAATQTVKGFDAVVARLKKVGFNGNGLAAVALGLILVIAVLLLLYWGTVATLFVSAFAMYIVTLVIPYDFSLSILSLSLTGVEITAVFSVAALGMIFVVARLIDVFAHQAHRYADTIRSFFNPDHEAEEREPEYKFITRKLAAFGIVLPGLNFLFVLMHASLVIRALVVVTVFLGVAAGMTLSDAGRLDRAQELAVAAGENLLKYLVPGLLVLAVLAVAPVFFLGFLPSGTGTNVLSWFQNPWNQTLSAIFCMIVVGVVLAFMLKDKDTVRTVWGYGFWAVLLLLVVTWFNTTTVFQPISNWWHGTNTVAQATTTPAAVAPVQPTPRRTRPQRSRTSTTAGDNSMTAQCARRELTQSLCNGVGLTYGR